MAETIQCARIHRNSHQSQIKEDTGEPSVLVQEINIRTYSQEIQAKYLPPVPSNTGLYRQHTIVNHYATEADGP